MKNQGENTGEVGVNMERRLRREKLRSGAEEEAGALVALELEMPLGILEGEGVAYGER